MTAMETMFAPAERAGAEELKRLTDTVTSDRLLTGLLDRVPVLLLLLNDERQIVYANRSMQAFTGSESLDGLCGLRPGEALHCIHAHETEGGCGTTEFCRTCGAAHVILEAVAGQSAASECRISREPAGESLDLAVTAAPLELEGETVTLFTASDIAHEKRRSLLERTFFHDIMNTAGGLQGLAEMMAYTDAEEQVEILDMLGRQAERLVEEIQAQRDLLAAERGDLAVGRSAVDVAEFLASLRELYCNHEVAEGKEIVVETDAPGIAVATDPRLAGRVIGNMLKNALEATPAGGTVTLGGSSRSGGVRLRVHNSTVMPREVQLQIFERSYSTKGAGRGIGTYSMKLLGEGYLGGQVGFTSAEGEGTTFYLDLPAG